ncbi:helix-turn-helix domain-containing protein [Streptomyces sp. JNUCC 64]
MSTNTPHHARNVGQRIAATRQARRLTQAELARAAHLSLPTVKAIERGVRSPSDASLESIAAALRTDPARFVSGYTGTELRVQSALPRLSAAIAAYDIPLGPPTRAPDVLRRAVEDAALWRGGAQYGLIAQHAPALVTDCLALFHHSAGQERLTAARLLTSVARTADAAAYKHSAHDLSARLIDLMRWASAHVGDPLLRAGVAYVRAETFFAARAHEAGLRALENAIDDSPPPSAPAAAAARGALHMRAAVLAGRAGDGDSAIAHLAEARSLSATLNENVYGGTAFGPDSVRVHEASVAISLGGDHVARALDLAHAWSPPPRLTAERSSGFHIEIARAQVWSGRMTDAYESLRTARRIAPQHTRRHPWAQEATRTLRRVRRTDSALTGFAEWMGVV